MSKYQEVHQQSLSNPEQFWGEAASGISWTKPWDKVLDYDAKPIPRWFVGAELNTCYNCLDRHVEAGRGDQDALIYDSPVSNTKRRYTYSELTDAVAKFAGVMKANGVEKGDRVIIYMPMIPEAAIAMLACSRLGAVHSVVFGGFAANELATRINDAKPKMIVSASCGIEPSRVVKYKPLLDDAIELATHKVGSVVIKARPEAEATLIEGRDLDWDTAVASAEAADCVPVAATDPLYILYTSGTTGQPKGVIRDNGGHAVAMNWSMGNIYNVKAGDVFWAASDVGWVVGHSYIVYAPLLKGCTTIVYEGKPVGTPDAGAFWRMIEEYQVKVLFTAPTAFRAIKKEDANADELKKYKIDCLQSLFLAGERCDPDTLFWARDTLGISVVDLWIMSRTDDVINVAGHRLSTGAIEEVLAGHPDVAECAVFGVSDSFKGQLPLGLVVLKDGTDRHQNDIVPELVKRVRDQIGPVAAFKIAAVVQRLPKTRSGKILRASMVKIADGTEWTMPATIDDPTIMAEIEKALQGLGYAKS
ncbi:AMP-binding protein [Leucothrix mucor]|uniref:AMP-binding protein n=1 Tax=Leucothrix mucor TaxID=45248 RepID=UPI0003B3C78A|nr:AMP-binding protein [Leucothrix mucor]